MDPLDPLIMTKTLQQIQGQIPKHLLKILFLHISTSQTYDIFKKNETIGHQNYGKYVSNFVFSKYGGSETFSFSERFDKN